MLYKPNCWMLRGGRNRHRFAHRTRKGLAAEIVANDIATSVDELIKEGYWWEKACLHPIPKELLILSGRRDWRGNEIDVTGKLKAAMARVPIAMKNGMSFDEACRVCEPKFYGKKT